MKNTITNLDPIAEVYLFGSVAENKNTYKSDIDILIITQIKPEQIHAKLWKAGIKEPFEIHIH
ncbi:MAG: nucleotidyltransferase domain-containing protein [Candidatus Ranarchaeia archaeon]